MAAMEEAAAAADPRQLLATCKRRLAEFLQEVDDTDLVWLEEIRAEAIRMFSSHYRDEPELMPKTPSQKRRQRRKRCAVPRNEEMELGRKRLSQESNSSLRPSTRSQSRNKENLELSRAEMSPPRRVTRSQTAALAKISEVPQIVLSKSPALQERKPLSAEANLSNCISAELCLQVKSPGGRQQLRGTFVVMTSDKDPHEEDQVGRASAVPAAPKADHGGEPVGTPQLNAATTTPFVVSTVPGLEAGSVQAAERDEQEALRRAQDVPGTPKGLRLSRRSVRRSLLGRAPPGRGSSAAAKRCRSSRGGRKVSASAGRVATRARPRPSAASCADDSSSEEVPESEGTVVKAGPSSDPCSPPRQAPQSPPTSLGPQAVGRQEQQPQEPSSPGQGWGRAGAGSPATPRSPWMSLRSRTLGRQEQPSSQERNSNKSGKTQEPPQSARRKPSYKRAVDECYDQQQAEEGGLSPPRKKTPSPTFPASKVVRPIKTFLHTVQKNQLLMTPSSLGGSMGLKSFIRHNTPLQTDPRERERQKLQVLKKKQEADELRKQRLEEEKRRRLDEAKLRREERQRRVQERRERALQLEQDRRRRFELKMAHLEEKTEKVREERLAEEKIRKRAAAKKLEEAEARRRQEEEARMQRALQQEEEERRHRELLQKRKEEEQEQARRILQQRQAEQEREKQLAAQRELERKKEQERIQAEKLREQQQKAACLQKEALAAQQRLQKDEQQKELRPAEVERQEHKKLPEEQQHKDRAQTQHPEEQKAKDGVQAEQPENPENSGACNSYQLTPHAQRDPKPFSTDPNNYGLDLNSDDSTDDESQPRKPIPAWASGEQLSQAVTRQYYNPPNVDEIFGVILSPRLEDIFGKSKPRYFKRTSSAVWSSPPCGLKPALPPSCSLKKC